MPPEENQNTEKITLPTSDEVTGGQAEENHVSAEPKQEIVGSVPAVEETQPIEQIENTETKVVEPIIEPVTEMPIVETTETIEQTENEETGSLHSVREDEVVEEIPETETPSTTPTQEIGTAFQSIIYKSN
ncbi:hypothetical protein L6261_03925 [Candidatus Parcubacteria bacterium]|nr:hypothetical protein [Candidatus Parcubacteria bacterium]